MPTQSKKQEVEELKKKLENAAGIVLSDYRGLSANEMNSMRELFTKKGVEYRVIKNTLAAIAAEELGFEELSELFEGPTGIAMGYEDPVLPFKISFDTEHEYDVFANKGGIIEGDFVGPGEIENISQLSSKGELLAQVAIGLKSPLQQLAYALKVKVRDLALVLNEVKKGKEE